MKRECLAVILLTAFFAACGCQKQQQQTAADGVREGVRQHLSSLKTLDLSAMNINFTNISVNGDAAQAQVEFSPKTGAPSGAGMRVSYSLEKRDGQWVVVKKNSLGGEIEHPAPGANPHVQPGQGAIHGNLPNFREILPSTQPDAPSSQPAASSTENSKIP